jgi:hypothetical protein
VFSKYGKLIRNEGVEDAQASCLLAIDDRAGGFTVERFCDQARHGSVDAADFFDDPAGLQDLKAGALHDQVVLIHVKQRARADFSYEFGTRKSKQRMLLMWFARNCLNDAPRGEGARALSWTR